MTFAAQKTEAMPPSDPQASLVQDRLETNILLSSTFSVLSSSIEILRPVRIDYDKEMTSPQTEPEEGAAESSVKSEVDVKKQLFTTDAETNTVSSSGQS